ncbi:AraC family transcriptional regulator [Leucothrix sargassi]|nr:AraC family transcriptional regulator [Leucothrix sargassi]
MMNLKTVPQAFAADDFPVTQNDTVVPMGDRQGSQRSITSQCSFNGLTVHYCDVVESRPLTVSEHLPAGISIDLLFEGGVSFELADQQYRVEATSRGQLESAMCVLSHASPFKLYLEQGKRVKKINLFAEQAWFNKRLKHPMQLSALNTVFANHAQVKRLNITKEIVALASELASLSQLQAVEKDQLLEDKAVQLLMLCMKQFLGAESVLFKGQLQQGTTKSLNEQVSELISNESAGQAVTLQDIANEVNLSVSTLQRRFKSMFGMTVIEYARIERLEKAKRALIVDDLSVGEVAYLTGYQHSSSFVSAFTKHFGMSPARYKSTHQ